VKLRATGTKITLHITDNGKGILSGDTQKSKSLGIVGMKERALFLGGHLDVAGAPGGGTVVALEVPMNGTEQRT
jgi:signal transduction histidine kinase